MAPRTRHLPLLDEYCYSIGSVKRGGGLEKEGLVVMEITGVLCTYVSPAGWMPSITERPRKKRLRCEKHTAGFFHFFASLDFH